MLDSVLLPTYQVSNRTFSKDWSSGHPSPYPCWEELIKSLEQGPALCMVAPACGTYFSSSALVGLCELRISSLWGNLYMSFRPSFMTNSRTIEQVLLGNEKRL